jgi:tetratricopeptide (TPR) repeat protein
MAGRFVVLVALAAAPIVSGAQSFDDLIARGRAQLDSNKADDAVKSFEKAVKANDKNADAHLWLARALGTVAEKANVLRQPFLAKRTKSEFEKTVDLDPNSVGGHEGLLQFYLRAPGVMGGSVAKAREAAATIVRLNPYRGHIAQANIANHEKDLAGEEMAYRANVAEFPDSVRAVNALANFLANHDRAEESFAPVEAFLQRKPDDRLALWLFGRTAAVTGKQLDRGEQSLKSAMAMPDTPQLRISPEAFHLRLGDIAAKRGDKLKARAEYQAALKINPKFEQAKKALAAL